jgi:CHAT domain-containing protein
LLARHAIAGGRAGNDLRGTELVVLSACETGLGDLQDGEGVAGLRQAFHLAGAETTIATLWKIPDIATSDLIERFFSHMSPETGFMTGQNKADALGLAQRDMIQKARKKAPKTPHLFWAAFTLTGQSEFPAPEPLKD